MRQDWAYTFTAVKNPKGDLIIQGRPYFDRVVSTLPAGEVVLLEMRPWKEKRTNAQNRALWGPLYDSILLQLADAVGYDRHERAKAKDLIHEGLCGKYGGYEQCPITKREVRKFRTSKATKQEFHDYLEWLARFCAEEYGIVVELPGEAA